MGLVKSTRKRPTQVLNTLVTHFNEYNHSLNIHDNPAVSNIQWGK